MDSVISIVAVVLASIALGLVILLGRKLQIAQQQLAEQTSRLAAVEQDVKALYAGAAGVGGHLARIEKRMHNLSDRQEKLDEHDVSGQHYSQAIELLREGAGIDEIMQRCGLTREEAELLQRLHGVSS